MLTLTRVLFFVAGIAVVFPVHAELTCEQIVASAQTAVTLRDQGVTLSLVLAETESTAMRERFRPDELAMLRRTIRLSYTGEVSVYELSDSCTESRGGKKR
jgi:hypothetical protein